MRVRLLQYRRGSAGAKALATALGIKRATEAYRPRRTDTILNWGHAIDMYPVYAPTYLNHPNSVLRARDKGLTFEALSAANVPCVQWTRDERHARAWNSAVVCRTTLTGQGGAGIVIDERRNVDRNDENPLPHAPLYTQYFKAKHEYRVHVVRDCVVDVQKKRRRDGAQQSLVRNLANGYVYCRGGVVAPESVLSAANQSIAALGLDFGAVDILCTDKGEARVLEVNTAPGLEGTTVTKYAEALDKVIYNRRTA